MTLEHEKRCITLYHDELCLYLPIVAGTIDENAEGYQFQILKNPSGDYKFLLPDLPLELWRKIALDITNWHGYLRVYEWYKKKKGASK